jgi:hypothetical protein
MAEEFLQKLKIQDDEIQLKKRVVNEIIEHGQARRYVTRITDGQIRRFRIVMVVSTILAAFQHPTQVNTRYPKEEHLLLSILLPTHRSRLGSQLYAYVDGS